MKLQTETETYRTVCFSPEKHRHFKSNYESSSPVKITNYNLKRNASTDCVEIHINKSTKLEDPTAGEINFDLQKPVQPAEPIAITDIQTILQSPSKGPVTVTGKDLFLGQIENILTKGKMLKKQETLLTDNSASIRLVLWENEITKVNSESAYKLIRVMVREYNDNKYLTVNKQTIVARISEEFTRQHESDLQKQFNTAQCPAEGVKNLVRFLSCYNCYTKVVPPPDKKIVTGSECGLS